MCVCACVCVCVSLCVASSDWNTTALLLLRCFFFLLSLAAGIQFLIRDWEFESHEHGAEGGREYLESVLEVSEGEGKQAAVG